MVTDSIRNIKSMWEKGSVFNAPGGGGSAFKVIIILIIAVNEAEQEEEGERFCSTSCFVAVMMEAEPRLTSDLVRTGSGGDKDGRGGPHQRLAE